MDTKQPEKRTVTPEKAVKILQEYGTTITVEEAELILDFLYNLAKLALNQVFVK